MEALRLSQRETLLVLVAVGLTWSWASWWTSRQRQEGNATKQICTIADTPKKEKKLVNGVIGLIGKRRLSPCALVYLGLRKPSAHINKNLPFTVAYHCS